MYFKVRKNKRSMEYITHMRKLQSINTFARSYDYTITLIMREKNSISFLRIECYLFEKKTPLHTPSLKDANNCTKFVWNWPSSSGEGEFKNFVNVFLLFHNYLPLEKGMTLCFNKIESSSPTQGCFCVKFGWNWLSVSGEDDNVKENKDRQVKDGQQVIRNWYSHRLFYFFDEKISNGQALAFCKWSSLYRYLLPLVFLHSPLLER